MLNVFQYLQNLITQIVYPDLQVIHSICRLHVCCTYMKRFALSATRNS